MKHIKKFNEEKNWIQDAVKKPGALRKYLHKKKGEKITQSEINDEISKLKKKDKDKDKPGLQLNAADRKKYKRLTLAKTLKGLHENNGQQNYMSFENLELIKKMATELLELNQNQIDEILNEHDWAEDHITTSKDHLEDVYNFLISNDKESEEEEIEEN